jgi:4-hydroxy-2-oxoheptanedioate aldolase
MIQIETRGALDAVEEIAALPGVDALFVGPYDLGVALGVTPGAATPEVQEAAGHVAAAAREAGKGAAVFLGDPALAPTYRDLGFTLISAGFTSVLLAGATDAIRAALQP